MEDVRAGGYEPRVLRIRGYYQVPDTYVIWLYSSGGRPDLFYRFDTGVNVRRSDDGRAGVTPS
jgi:hypothetical protein